jgi:hypothetical protein
MPNTLHSVSNNGTTQKLLDFVRKIVDDNSKTKYTGTVTLCLVFNQGGLRLVEHQTKVSFNIKESDY